MRLVGEYVGVVTGYHGARMEYCRAEGNGKEGAEDIHDRRAQD